ncbi:hypothetical protein GUITHDRAFT_104054 [Guillardia theta CCMP2712]|uniref:Uncharacterized protein n=1 Tax=Guillardia theta (strain CCMP2712) TaxID=905079 RepID=L1JPX6_GUITC|nr:hypothetical protein GUITHDRAFT_104054 [Guillardia theta CCMP2712]EKX50240.1 hypothetical protein GUITHDRAFT_104054 [Guillardia theta CCMP2712]|eukprot:XP_005837220.1 hypothetical protein GUITHDRAFT_104054 [Guillardia theta CCMP2712]
MEDSTPDIQSDLSSLSSSSDAPKQASHEETKPTIGAVKDEDESEKSDPVNEAISSAFALEYQQRNEKTRRDYAAKFQQGVGSGTAGVAGEPTELLPRFEPVFSGHNMEVIEDGRTLRKKDWSIVHGRVLGLDRKVWYEDKEENVAYGYQAPSTLVLGRSSSMGVERYSFLIREIQGGSFFLGFLELPFKPVQQWPNFFDTCAWMLADGGNVFRTGPDVGGEGYYDSPQDELPLMGRRFAMKTGFEVLTELLRRELYTQYPNVTTPGIWTFGEGSVVSLEINREERELRFEVNDAPPFTLRNVSSSALPFVTLLYPNDTVSLLSPAEEQFFRARWKSKRRGPEDPDYWVWDWERWRPSDGGLIWKDGKYVEDPNKKNRWFPTYDNNDGRSPVPGLSLTEYLILKSSYDEQAHEKRKKERERRDKKTLERGDMPRELKRVMKEEDKGKWRDLEEKLEELKSRGKLN